MNHGISFMCGMIVGFCLGLAVALTGNVLAQQSWSGYSSDGTTTTIYENAPGMYSWSNSRGQTGLLNAAPTLPPLPSYTPGYGQRNPC